MSTGPEHYTEAERLLAEIAADDRQIEDLLAQVIRGERDGEILPSAADITSRRLYLSALAQVHATLALAAATALSGVIGNNVAASHPINQLADDAETITAANDWHETATRKTQP